MPIIIDASVIFTNPFLIPLRFPFSSIFPIIGSGLGALYLRKKRILFLFATICFFIFLYLSHNYIIPKIIFFTTQKTSLKLEKNIYDFSFYTIEGKKIKLRDTAINRCTIIECFFKGCAPCEKKIVDLKILKDTIKSEELNFIFICDGTITSFIDFIDYSKSRSYSNFTFLYDKEGILKEKFKINSYPFEFFTKKEELIGTTTGYDEMMSKEYLRIKIKQIKQIINEENH